MRDVNDDDPNGETLGQMLRRFRTASRPTLDELRLRRQTVAALDQELTAAEQMARARRRSGLTQEELVARSGLSVEGLRKIERDRVCPQPDTVRLLARALQLSTTEEAALFAATEQLRRARDRAASGTLVTSEHFGACVTSQHAGAPVTTQQPVAAGVVPAPLTSLVGRSAALATVTGLLTPISIAEDAPADVPCRLLTLTGPGGCGKTRLALAVAAALMDRFAAGVRLVELGTLPPDSTSAFAVEGSATAALGLRGRSSRQSLGSLIVALRDRQLLLVLDNCEHLLVACRTLVAALLRACPGVRVLATSREALGMPGEVVWPVAPLATPPDCVRTLGELAHYDAVTLFVARTRARMPGFTLTAEHAATVARICRRLDGLPLALELAAARLPTLSLAELAARLDDRFSLLTRGNGAAAPRQQTLRATMDWSFRLLSPPATVLFGRLSPFAGGWTLDAATAVCADATLPPALLLEALTELVDRSLVQAAQAVDQTTTRYQMLETVHDYARICQEEALGAGVSLPEVCAQHLAWCYSLATGLEERREEHARERRLQQLEQEHDNLRAALAFGLADPSQALAVLRLSAALWPFWQWRGSLREGRRWLERALALRGSQPAHSIALLRARAAALNAAARLAECQGAQAQAQALQDERARLLAQLYSSDDTQTKSV